MVFFPGKELTFSREKSQLTENPEILLLWKLPNIALLFILAPLKSYIYQQIDFFSCILVKCQMFSPSTVVA